MKGNIWITWNDSLRSINLSKDLELPLFEKVIKNTFIGRHLLSSFWSITILVRNRPRNIYLQYSFMLLVVVVFYKLLMPYPVYIICDCHTKALRRDLDGFVGKLFGWIKTKSFQHTNLAIISNVGMKQDIDKLTDRYFILPDKIPEITANQLDQKGENYCVFVCSYAEDEPLEEVISAAKLLNGIVNIYCTGMIPKDLYALRDQPYQNIYFTDYLDRAEYNKLIVNASCILALTSEEGCLQCAGYEALSVSAPLVVSDTSALKRYFGSSAIYVKNKAEEIAYGINCAITKNNTMQNSIHTLKSLRRQEYESRISELKAIVGRLGSSTC